MSSSSDAEKAWNDWFDVTTEHAPCYPSFMAGRESRDAEVADRDADKWDEGFEYSGELPPLNPYRRRAVEKD